MRWLGAPLNKCPAEWYAVLLYEKIIEAGKIVKPICPRQFLALSHIEHAPADTDVTWMNLYRFSALASGYSKSATSLRSLSGEQMQRVACFYWSLALQANRLQFLARFYSGSKLGLKV